MERGRLLAISLAASLASLLALYSYSWTINPVTVRIGDIGPEDAGAFVRTGGHVRSSETLGAGGLKIVLVDYSDFSMILVFVPGNVADTVPCREEIISGAQLRVAGEVQEFNGDIEIVISHESMIEVLAIANENRLGLDTLALNPKVFADMHVLVRGRLYDMVTVVDRDKSMIHNGGISFWVDDSERRQFSGSVDVTGMVLFNEKRGRYEVKVAGEGDTISPHPIAVPDGYEVVSLSELSDSPEVWEGHAIAILGVQMVAGEVIGSSFSLTDFIQGEMYRISCTIFRWGWTMDKRGISDGIAVDFAGTWGYYAEEAQWQITSNEFTLQPLP